jgi:hypothetical protein
MPLYITELELDSIEALSIVDKGASGDEENRPAIMLYKRDKSKMFDKIKSIFVSKQEENQMPVKEKLAELGLSEEQMAAVLQILEQLAAPAPAPVAPAPAPAAPTAPVGKTDDEEEEEPMDKRDAEHKAELLKREAKEIALQKRVDALEEQAEIIEIEKKADEYKWLPQSKEETIEILKAAKGDKTILAMLEKTNEAMKESPVFKVYGHSGDGESSTEAELNKRAGEIRTADPKVDETSARVQAMQESPELYREALAAQRQG